MSELVSLINQSRSFLVILGPEASFDHWISATTWYLALVESGKIVQLATSNLPTSKKITELELAKINGYNFCRTDLNNQNATVSFDYSDQSVDSVSYVLDEFASKFILTIKPKLGCLPLNLASIKSYYSGTDAEVIILIGVHNLEKLGKLYSNNLSVFQKAQLVTINNFAPDIANIAITTENFICMAEATTQALNDADLTITPDMASNLLFGIEKQTDWLSSLQTTAKTFEIVALLLKMGAKRQPRNREGLAKITKVATLTPKSAFKLTK